MAADLGPAGLPVIAFANRLPVRRVRSTWRLSDGGLVTALRPAMKSRGGVWVGWDGGIETPGRSRARDRASARVADAGARSTRTTTASPTERSGRCCTASSNGRRSTAPGGMPTGSSTPGSPRPTIRATPGFRWVHDYQLLLLPELLRRAGAQGGIGFFLHVPFPPPEVFSRLPWRRPCSRACSAPRSSRSTRPATATTSCAPAGSSSTASRSTARPSSCRTAAGQDGRAPDLDRRRRSRRAGAPARRRPGLRRPAQAVRRPSAPARRRSPRLHQGHPRAAARDRAAPRAAPRPAPRDHLRPGRRAEPRRDSRVPRAACRRGAARRPDQRPLHRAGLDVPVHYLYRGVTPDGCSRTTARPRSAS